MTLALIPARKGRGKNLWQLGGKPLVQWAIDAAKAAAVENIIVSTDCEETGDLALISSCAWHRRPAFLARDDSHIIEAVRDAYRPEWHAERVVLLQPTSPFVRPETIEACLALCRKWNGAQSITQVPHNHHEINQRQVDNGLVSFCHPNERRAAYNKQRKAPRYVFGNCLAFRMQAALDLDTVFPAPAGYVEVSRWAALDVDNEHDLKLAEFALREGLV